MRIVICKIFYDVELGTQFLPPVYQNTYAHMHAGRHTNAHTQTHTRTLHRHQMLHIYLFPNKKIKVWPGFSPSWSYLYLLVQLSLRISGPYMLWFCFEKFFKLLNNLISILKGKKLELEKLWTWGFQWDQRAEIFKRRQNSNVKE